MTHKKIEVELLVAMVEFVEMLSKQDDEKRKEIVDFFEKESGFKLPFK